MPDRSPAREEELKEAETEMLKRAAPDTAGVEPGRIKTLAEVVGEETYAQYASKRDNRIYAEMEAASATNAPLVVSQTAEVDKAERQKVIAPLKSEDALNILDDDSLQTRLKLWDAQKRKENVKLAAQMGVIETESEVTSQIENEIARHQANMQDIDKQIGKHRPLTKSSWRLTPEEEAQARGRNAEYLKMAIRTTRTAVKEVPTIPELVSDIIVDERTQIIERAVEQDKAERKKTGRKPRPKEQGGPKTKAVLNPPHFKKALQYAYKPWWEVAYLSTTELREIKQSHAMGNHISTLC